MIKTRIVSLAVLCVFSVTVMSINTATYASSIGLVASSSNLIPSDSGVTSLSSSFDMLTGNALVVSVPTRFGNPASDTIDVDFAGQSPDWSFIEQSGDRASVGTFVFLNPATTSGTVTVNLGSAARVGYAVYSLDNVGGVFDMPDADPSDGIATGGIAGAPEAFSENGNLDTTVDITYAGVGGGYAIHTLSGEGPGATPSITGDNVDVNPLFHANGDSGIFLTAISSGGQIAADGTYTTTNAYYRAGAMSTVVLSAVPEPSSFALIGLAGMALSLMRRR